MAAIFELHTLPDLPLWAQVLIASRMARRAALWLPADAPADYRDAIVAATEAIDRCAAHGGWASKADERLVRRATRLDPTDSSLYSMHACFSAAADSALGAISSTDFSAAETSCIAQVKQALGHAGATPGLNPIQIVTFTAAELDLLRFACKEARRGRYDPLTDAVLQRLFPVHPPAERDRLRTTPRPHDPTNGAR